MAQKTIRLDPEPGILIESLRDIGYSFNSALADIIDNSITAQAKNISIVALPIRESFRVSIVDDGFGLSHDDLLRAMRLGSSNPRWKREESDLGRFGLGLKTASFSQCRKLTVASKQEGRIAAFTWDLDAVEDKNSWSIIERTDVQNIYGLDFLGSSGTLVLWENVDRLTGSNGSGKVDYERVISESQDYLSLVFHRFIAGEPGVDKVDICMNGLHLKALDPFNTKNKATQTSPEEVVCPGVKLRSFTLPHISTYEDKYEYERYGLPGGYLKNQGVYLYRAKRLIIFGTWFGLAKKTALTQLTRVKIDIDADQDEIWKIDVKKVSAQMPEIVRKRVRTLIRTIGAPSRKVYRQRGARLTSPNAYPVWNRIQNDTGITYGINTAHPLVVAFRNSLDPSFQGQFDSLVAFIGAMLPTEALFYDLSNNAESVHTEIMQSEQFKDNVCSFFAVLKQFKDDDTAINVMKSIEPYKSHWEEALSALGIEEK
ncbi:ATP-binding protein [Bifidobacterium sp. ESL0790]|uniref:ATP-binding protein n=1 Tax=Bifidobacterium sp. ESL0790 TaxID=2983233 RepID=UPI0023F92CBF|nr:ATP-binding protein [Bifidobacterium sp. ESL0790]WEV71931.1 ATP-binding protein [Bifidobacterium sp. ESL0790]